MSPEAVGWLIGLGAREAATATHRTYQLTFLLKQIAVYTMLNSSKTETHGDGSVRVVHDPTVHNYMIQELDEVDLKDYEWSRQYINIIINTFMRSKHNLELTCMNNSVSLYMNFYIKYPGYGSFHLRVNFHDNSVLFGINVASPSAYRTEGFKPLVWSPNGVSNFRRRYKNRCLNRRHILFSPRKPRFKKWAVSALKYVRETFALEAYEYVLSI